jgi:hypothetical protein
MTICRLFRFEIDVQVQTSIIIWTDIKWKIVILFRRDSVVPKRNTHVNIGSNSRYTRIWPELVKFRSEMKGCIRIELIVITIRKCSS